MSDSVFVFLFRLTPWTACGNLYFDDLALSDTVAAACTRDVLVLRGVGASADFPLVQETCRELAAIFVDAHAYHGFPELPALGLEPLASLEVRESAGHVLLLGDGGHTRDPARAIPRHTDTVPFRWAAPLVTAALACPPLRLALADFRAARRDPTARAAFLAYRVVEDIATSVEPRGGDTAWAAMSTAFDTTVEHWQVLAEVGRAARCPVTGARVAIGRDERLRCLGLAKDALDRWIRGGIVAAARTAETFHAGERGALEHPLAVGEAEDAAGHASPAPATAHP